MLYANTDASNSIIPYDQYWRSPFTVTTTNTTPETRPMYLSAAEIAYLQRCIKADAKLARILYELLEDVRIEADLNFGVEDED